MKVILLALLCFLIVTGCNRSGGVRYEMIERMKWLEGTWQGNLNSISIHEKWIRLNDSTLNGLGFVLSGKDTISMETMTMEERGGTMKLSSLVKDQNMGLPVSFTLTASDSSYMTFENPSHDFPQKITYKKIDRDSLIASIEGIVNGKSNVHQFGLKRVAQETL